MTTGRLIFANEYYKPENRKNLEKFVRYLATRKGVDNTINSGFIDYLDKRPSSHGLFSNREIINLESAKREINEHQGIIFSNVISIRREDAERFGYNNAAAWKSLIKSKQIVLAENFKIPLENLRWYAAFHNQGHHPHCHLILYNAEPHREFLTERGWENIKSAFVNEIFKEELIQHYSEKTVVRDELRAQFKQTLADLNFKDNPQIELMLGELKQKLAETSGKKIYGYLKPPLKKLVDEIVREVAKDENIAKLYGRWCDLQKEIIEIYQTSDELPPLWEQKEFTTLKNAIIQEVLKPEVLPLETEISDEEVFAFWSEDYRRAKDFMFGLAAERDYAQGLTILRAEFENGNALAAFDLGTIYERGLGVEQNSEQAQEYYEKAYEGFIQSEKLNTKLKHLFQYKIGKMHLRGIGVEQNNATAAKWFEKSAAGGNKYAQYLLGSQYLKGNGVERDEKCAAELFREAEEQHHPYAAYELAKLYKNGVGVEADEPRADELFSKAFVQFQGMERTDESGKLSFRVGQMLSAGVGVERNFAEAVPHLKKAATHADPFAEFILGRIYFFGGYGVERDTDIGHEWLTLSAKHGNELAQSFLDDIQRRNAKYWESVAMGHAFNIFCGLARSIETDYEEKHFKWSRNLDSKDYKKLAKKKLAMGMKLR